MVEKNKACYLSKCDTSRTANNKQAVQSGQYKSAHIVYIKESRMTKKDTPFGSRLRSALSKKAGVDRLSDAQIAKIYGEILGAKSESGVANFLKGGRYPDINAIMAAAQFVDRSIDWLLTGRDETTEMPRISPKSFGANQRLFIEMLAAASSNTFEDVVKELVGMGLDAKARDMSLAYRVMSEQELREVLDAFLANAEQDEDNRHERVKRR